jgi:hypothetical protein
MGTLGILAGLEMGTLGILAGISMNRVFSFYKKRVTARVTQSLILIYNY